MYEDRLAAVMSPTPPAPEIHRPTQAARRTTPLQAVSLAAAPVEGIHAPRPNIKVLGLGGGGSNAVNRMIELGLTGIDFIAANTDRQALASSLAPTRVQLGPRVTRGLGAGGDPDIGAAAAMESSKDIAAAVSGADMVFLTAGMGGGTGTGSAPVAAEIARERGTIVVAVVTMPFSFEMTRRGHNALEGVRRLQPHTHTLITIPNDRLLQVAPHDITLEVAFRLADDVLRQGVQAVAELVTRPGLINVDFAHLRELMAKGGGAFMAIGLGQGPTKARNAIQQALHHPLLEIDSLEGASGLLVHFTGGEDLTLFEVGEAITDLRQGLSPDIDVVLGATMDSTMEGRAQAILVVTGLGAKPVQQVDNQGISLSQIASQAGDLIDMSNLDLPAFIRRRSGYR